MKARSLLALLVLALVLLAPAASAQTVQTFVRNYDLSATSLTYCATSAEATGPFNIATSGSSTTTTSAVAAQTPFSLIGVGDRISVVISGTKTYRTVTAKASGSSITVNSAWNVGTNAPWKYTHLACGTAITDGWVQTSSQGEKLIKIDANTMTGTGGIDYSIECRVGGDGGLTPAQLYLGNFTNTTVPTNSFIVLVPEACSNVRLGLMWHTADTAGTDDITAVIQGTVQN